MFTLISTVASFLAGFIDVAKSLVAEHDKQQVIEQGQLEEQSKEQVTKAHDEGIANKVDSEPVPSDKHSILGGM